MNYMITVNLNYFVSINNDHIYSVDTEKMLDLLHIKKLICDVYIIFNI